MEKKIRYPKKNFIVMVTLYLCLTVPSPSFSFAQLVCLIPEYEKKSHAILDKFVTLKEPKTIAKFDEQGNLKSIQSPNCNKFESSSAWSNKIVVICVSNSGDNVTIKIDTKNHTFIKEKSNSFKKLSSLSGFCRTL